MALDDDLLGFPVSGDGKDVVPLLKQIERNTRLLPESIGRSSRGGAADAFASSKLRREAKESDSLPASRAGRRGGMSSAKSSSDAVARGVARGFQAALGATASQLSEVVQDAAKATAVAQKKANLDLVKQQKKIATGPKSVEGLQRYRESRQSAAMPKESAMRQGWMRQLFAQAKELAGKHGKSGDVTDAAGQLAAGGPIWGAFKELSEVAESAKESLDGLRKTTDKSEKQAQKVAAPKGSIPARRDRKGRYQTQDQGEIRRHRELLTAVKSSRGGSIVSQEGGGGLLSGLDDAMDIWGHAKGSKWGNRAGGMIGKAGRAGKGLLGKGLGLLGMGGLGAGALGVGGAVAGGTVAAGGVGLAGRMMGKLGVRALPGIGQALAVGLAAFDGVQSYNDKGLHKQAFGLKDGEEATVGQKSAAAAAGVLDMGGLTSFALGAFGIDTDASKIAKSLYSGVDDLVDTVKINNRVLKDEPSWLSKLVDGSLLGGLLGGKKQAPKTEPQYSTGEQVAKASGAEQSVAAPAQTGRLLEQFGRPDKGASQFTTITPGKSASLDVINEASAATGVDAGTLAKIAKVESNLNPNAKAGTSSAGGLFQFTDSTWAATVATHGAKHGIAPGTSKFDPKANALMGGELYKQTKADLSRNLGREATEKDVYMGHFLGTAGATKFLKGMQANPTAEAATFASDDAVRANRPIFQDKTGKARTAQEVYDLMGGKLDRAGVALQKDGSLQAMQDPMSSTKSSGVASGLAPFVGAGIASKSPDMLDATTLNMPIKTDRGILTPRQMGVKTFSELGQRGGQAFAGGQNDATTTWLTAQIMQKTGASHLSAQNDSYHQKNSPGSGHTKGIKTDFSYAGLSAEGYKGKHAEISSMLAQQYGMVEGQDYKIISSPHGTGKHIDFKLHPSGQKKAEAVRMATQVQTPGQPGAQVAAVENPKPETVTPSTSPATKQQAMMSSIQKRLDEAKASGDESQIKRWTEAKAAKEAQFGMSTAAEPPTAASTAMDERIATARATGNEVQAARFEKFRSSTNPARVAPPKARPVESATDIKAATPPPPSQDNAAVEKALTTLAQAQTQRNIEQERQTDDQSTPNIPLQFDEYTLQLWANDRA